MKSNRERMQRQAPVMVSSVRDTQIDTHVDMHLDARMDPHVDTRLDTRVETHVDTHIDTHIDTDSNREASRLHVESLARFHSKLARAHTHTGTHTYSKKQFKGDVSCEKELRREKSREGKGAHGRLTYTNRYGAATSMHQTHTHRGWEEKGVVKLEDLVWFDRSNKSMGFNGASAGSKRDERKSKGKSNSRSKSRSKSRGRGQSAGPALRGVRDEGKERGRRGTEREENWKEREEIREEGGDSGARESRGEQRRAQQEPNKVAQELVRDMLMRNPFDARCKALVYKIPSMYTQS
mmetsp:Transcript_85835/g.125614  ORF Transcript_85835/g.125614 Transcript_85835/m.125614 type:complete len:294 (-) Transcript_85835:97-978(-)